MFISTWNDFEKSVERLCQENPSNVRYSMKYNHSKGLVEIKVTDNKKVSTPPYLSLSNIISTNLRGLNRLHLLFSVLSIQNGTPPRLTEDRHFCFKFYEDDGVDMVYNII